MSEKREEKRTEWSFVIQYNPALIAILLIVLALIADHALTHMGCF